MIPRKMVLAIKGLEQITERPNWAKYVIEFCRRTGRSRASIARKADVGEATFNHMLAGRYNATDGYLSKIEKAMGIKSGTLQELNKPKGSKPVKINPKSDT